MRSRQQIISARLTPIQFEGARLAAENNALTISEWLRQVVVTQTSHPEPVLETLIEQIEALRMILNNIVLYLTTDGLEITKKSLTTICAQADHHKAAHARLLLDRATHLSAQEK